MADPAKNCAIHFKTNGFEVTIFLVFTLDHFASQKPTVAHALLDDAAQTWRGAKHAERNVPNLFGIQSRKNFINHLLITFLPTRRPDDRIKTQSYPIACGLHALRGAQAFVKPGGLMFDSLGHFLDRKSTRLNSSHQLISYAVFC